MKSFLSVVLLFLSFAVQSDDMRPAALRLLVQDEGQVAVTWRLPLQSDNQPIPLNLKIDGKAIDFSNALAYRENLYWVAKVTLPLESTFDLLVEGLAVNRAEVIVSIDNGRGNSSTYNLNAEAASLTIDMTRQNNGLFNYLRLGVEHILEGADHLLFVAALLLLVRGIKALLATITAFTFSHSITLVLASLGYINLPGPPVEAVIALSIIFVAREVIQLERGKTYFSVQKPWLVALCFGLLHGLGFASVLAQIGLPEDGIIGALLMFNLGVEIGQIIFVLAVLSLTKALSFVAPAWLMARLWPTYCIGSVASFWMIERMAWF